MQCFKDIDECLINIKKEAFSFLNQKIVASIYIFDRKMSALDRGALSYSYMYCYWLLKHPYRWYGISTFLFDIDWIKLQDLC